MCIKILMISLFEIQYFLNVLFIFGLYWYGFCIKEKNNKKKVPISYFITQNSIYYIGVTSAVDI